MNSFPFSLSTLRIGSFTAWMVLCLLLSSPASAYAADNTAFLQAFRHSYENPSDVNAALKYSEEAVKIGNYEAAIPPLERILMFNPSLSEVRLEVGVLYYLLNSADMAKKHLSMVAADPKATDVSKARATSYLAKL
jgi:tetratricopeptide (TPR) repeat protein